MVSDNPHFILFCFRSEIFRLNAAISVRDKSKTGTLLFIPCNMAYIQRTTQFILLAIIAKFVISTIEDSSFGRYYNSSFCQVAGATFETETLRTDSKVRKVKKASLNEPC